MGVFFVPLITQRETYVECCRCGRARLTSLPLSELGKYTATELDPHLRERVSIIVQFFAIASVWFACVPFVGLLLGVIGFLASTRGAGWTRRVSLIGSGVGLFVSLIVGILLLIGK